MKIGMRSGRTRAPAPGRAQAGWRPGDELWQREIDMRRMTEAGELLDLGKGPSNLAAMHAWRRERTIRAEVLRHLLVDKKWQAHAKGVQLRGLRIMGHLDLEAATLRCPLHLENCYFDDAQPVNLNYASASVLAITRCRLAGVTGDTLLVTKDLDLGGSDFSGKFSCTDATGTGVGSDGGARAANRGYALFFDRMKVSGNVILNEKFTAAGVCLNNADISGVLDCTCATLTAEHSQRFSLWADGMKVGGNVILDHCIVEGGAVRLSAAEIGGELLCHGTLLRGTDDKDNALRANRMQVGSNVNLNEGFTANGTVSLKYTAVGGSLRLELAEAENREASTKPQSEPSAIGVTADHQVTGDLERGLRTSLKVALEATGAQIEQELVWLPKTQIHGKVILEGATAGHLIDCWTERDNGYWPPAGEGLLRLDGFTYNRITYLTADQRLKWIGSQPVPPWSERVRRPLQTWRKSKDRRALRDARALYGFAPQPYEQLAYVYQQAGRDTEARTVAIARRRDLRQYGKLTWYRKPVDWLLEKTIQYGYQTGRAVVLLALLYLVVAAFFCFAKYQHNAVIPVQTTTGHPTATSCTVQHPQYPCFNPFGYAINTVIPLINVHQADFWGPNEENVPWGLAGVYVTYVGTAFGWIFVTLAVAGATGLVSNATGPVSNTDAP